MARPRSLSASRTLSAAVLPLLDERTLLGAVALLLLALILFVVPSYPVLTRFRPEALRDLPDVLAPLVVLALFIERAVEVVLAGWRQGGAMLRETRLTRMTKEGTVDEQWGARVDLDLYTAHSQRLALFCAFVISLLTAMMGVRAIEMLVDRAVVAGAPAPQRSLFVHVDILVTALLLTGGADGIHKVVNAFTTFVEQTKYNVREARRNPAAADTPPPGGAEAGR